MGFKKILTEEKQQKEREQHRGCIRGEYSNIIYLRTLIFDH